MLLNVGFEPGSRSLRDSATRKRKKRKKKTEKGGRKSAACAHWTVLGLKVHLFHVQDAGWQQMRAGK